MAPRYKIVGDQIVPIDGSGPSMPLPGRGKSSSRGSVARRQQQRDGNECEQVMGALHEQCRIAGVARVVKLPTPFKVVRRLNDRELVVVPEEKSTVDYVGHFIGGSAIYLEAKKLSDTSLNFAKRLADHQIEALTDAEREGQTSILAIVQGALVAPVIFAIPWRVVRERIAAGEKSLPMAEMGSHRVSRLEPYLARFAPERRVAS